MQVSDGLRKDEVPFVEIELVRGRAMPELHCTNLCTYRVALRVGNHPPTNKEAIRYLMW